MTTPCRVLMIVNGAEDSPMGIRARSFVDRMDKAWQPWIVYRHPRRGRALLEFLRELVRVRPQVAYVLDMAAPGVLAAGLESYWGSTRVVVDTGDAIVDLGRTMGRGWGAMQLTRGIEAFALSRADTLVVRGSQHAELLGRHSPVVIPDGVDLTQFSPGTADELRQSLGLGDACVLGVLGSVIFNPARGTCYGWDLVEAIALLQEFPVKGLLVGGGDGLSHLKARARELGVENRICFAGQVSYEKLPGYLRAMDICLSTQSNDVVGQVRTTGKLPLYLGVGRFVIASRVGEAARVLPERMLLDYDGSFDSNYPKRVAARVAGLLGEPESLQCAEDVREIAARHFDYDVLAQRVDSVLRQTLEQGG